MSITDTKCEVPLQNLLNKTCERIVKYIHDSPMNEQQPLQLICKRGFDGSSGYSSYKLQSSERPGPPKAEESLFATSLVPLRLINNESGDILWKNPRPASKRFCRSLTLQWIQETNVISRIEEAYIKNQIENLIPYESSFGPITFNLSLTMVDGKVNITEAQNTSTK